MYMNNSLEISRAKFAYDMVSQVKNNKQYLSLIRSFPIMIHNNGYITAMTFLFSNKADDKKKENEYNYLYNHITGWLVEKKLHDITKDFMKTLTEISNENYKQISNETTAFLIWLKRFAEGMIGEKAKNTTGGNSDALYS